MEHDKPQGLQKLSTKIKVSDIYAFDIETYGDENEFLMGSIVGEDFKKTFYNRKHFISFLTSKKFYNGRGNPVIFATNLGFDILALFKGKRYFRKMFITNRGTSIIKVIFKKNEDNYITFLDTMNFIGFSVAAMGRLVGIPKKEFKDIGDEKEMRKRKQELIEYNLNDCEITRAFAVLLQKGFNELGCDMKTTVASTAMNLFRRKYLEYPMYLTDEKIRDFIFKAYYGGRTETFYRGNINSSDFKKESIYYYDVNSLYPFCMNKFIFPNTNFYRTAYSDESKLKYEGVSDVDLFCPDMMYPFLPMRINNKLIFPCGNITGHYTHIEIKKALEIGYKLINLRQSLYYVETHRPFKKYVEDLYKKRLEYKKEKNPLELVTKLLLNSLYGKFAQKPEHEEVYYIDSLTSKEYLDKTTKYETSTVDEWLYVKVDDQIPKFSHPIYSAYITGYARTVLYDYMIKAKTVLYVDTDSIITPTKMNTSKELGDLKIEHEIKNIMLIKPKMYYINDIKPILKIKGVRKLKETTDFMSIARGETTRYMKFTKFKESIRRHLVFNKKLFVDKKIGLDDDKRFWDGKKFSPDEMQISEAIRI